MLMLCEIVNGTFFLSRSQSLVRVIVCQLYDLLPHGYICQAVIFFLLASSYHILYHFPCSDFHVHLL